MSEQELRLPQVRVLRALAGGGALTRARLSVAAGYTAVSGTVTRALNGLKEGSSSGPAHPGLLALGYAEQHELELDGGETETVYVITAAGRAALDGTADVNLDPARPKASCINHRYKVY